MEKKKNPKRCSDIELHNVSIEHVQIFKQEGQHPSLQRCLDTYDHRLRRLPLTCASFKEGKLRSSSMLEQPRMML